MVDGKMTAELDGVPETLLWPLYCRAMEARRTDALMRDGKAIEVFESIDYPFEEHFGRPQLALTLRDLCFDMQIRQFLQNNPKGTVVALGGGLETQFWRVDNGQMKWISVDLEETQVFRKRLIPSADRIQLLSCSALNYEWMDHVDPANGVFITAQGLLMYLEEADVRHLISACADRFPNSTLMFDAVPRWLTRQAVRGAWFSLLLMRGKKKQEDVRAYRLPILRWSASIDQLREFGSNHPKIADVQEVPLPVGRGLVFGFIYPHYGSNWFFRNKRPCVTVFRFK